MKSTSLQVLTFVLATLASTALLVAAGLAEDSAAAQTVVMPAQR
jgi:hypothetical protein